MSGLCHLAHRPPQKLVLKFGTDFYTNVRVANFIECLLPDLQDPWSFPSWRWSPNPSSTAVKTIGTKNVLPSMSSCQGRHMSLFFQQRNKIKTVLAPEEFCDPERRRKLYFWCITWRVVLYFGRVSADELQPKAYCTNPGLQSFLLAPPSVSTRS